MADGRMHWHAEDEVAAQGAVFTVNEPVAQPGGGPTDA